MKHIFPFFLPTLFLLATASSAHAALRANPSLSELAANSSAIVLATPKDGAYVVDSIISGAGVAKGDKFQLKGYTLEINAFQLDVNRKLPAPKYEVARALLFLYSSGNRLYAYAARMLDTNNRVLITDLNPYGDSADAFIPMRDGNWDDLLKFVTATAANVAKARQLKEIKDPLERNRAILKWLTDHAAEIREGGWSGYSAMDVSEKSDYKPPKHDPDFHFWGSVPTELCDVVNATDNVDDVWQAVRLWHQFYPNLGYGSVTYRSPAFKTPRGRESAFALATDPKADRGERIFALDCIVYSGFGGTLNDSPDAYKQKQKAYIAKILPLISDPDPDVRFHAAYIIGYASFSADSLFQDYRCTDALDSLIARYPIEPPGNARRELAIAIRRIGGNDVWQKVSGNTGGVIAEFDGNYYAARHNLRATLNMNGSGSTVFSPPTAFAQRIVDGKVVETKPVIPIFGSDIDWKTGANNCVIINFDLSSLASGTWHIRLKGESGKPPQTNTWTSEPALAEIK